MIFPTAMVGYFNEGGVVEVLCAIMLALCAVLILFKRPVLAQLHLSLLCFLLAEREFEADLLAPQAWLRRANEWLEAHVLHQTLPVVILGCVLLCGAIIYSLPQVRALSLKSSSLAQLLLAGVGFAVTGQVAGESLKFLEEGLTPITAARLWITEELAEFFFALAVFCAVAGTVFQSRGAPDGAGR